MAGVTSNEQLTSTMHECIADITALTNRVTLLEQRIVSEGASGPRNHDGGVGLVDRKFF